LGEGRVEKAEIARFRTEKAEKEDAAIPYIRKIKTTMKPGT